MGKEENRDVGFPMERGEELEKLIVGTEEHYCCDTSSADVVLADTWSNCRCIYADTGGVAKIDYLDNGGVTHTEYFTVGDATFYPVRKVIKVYKIGTTSTIINDSGSTVTGLKLRR